MLCFVDTVSIAWTLAKHTWRACAGRSKPAVKLVLARLVGLVVFMALLSLVVGLIVLVVMVVMVLLVLLLSD